MVVHLRFIDISFLGSSKKERGIQSDADTIVSPERRVSVAQKISGSWEVLAINLAPAFFDRNRVTVIRKSDPYDMVSQATFMLEQWSENFDAKATCRVLITALCKSLKRAVAANVFGAALVDYVQPQY